MRKNSFWLSLNPRTCPERPRQHPFRRRRPRHPCTRRRVSSEALRASGAPDAKKACGARHGLQPRRRPPFPFVSSSSSSLVSCGFPRSFRCILRSGVRFPEPLLRTALRSPSIGFKTGKSCSPELAFRCRFRGVSFRSIRCRPFRLPPRPCKPSPARFEVFRSRLPPRSRKLSPARFEVFRSRLPPVLPASAGSVQVGSEGRSAPSEDPGLPPGPGLLFRSFAVRFVHGSHLDGFVFSFRSFRLAFVCLSGSVRFPVRFVRF